MDFRLSQEDNMIKEAIRDWVTKECTREHIAEWDAEDQFPGKLSKKLAKLGFSGITVPEAFGGEGRNVLGACIVIEQLAVLYAPLARLFAGQTMLGGVIIEMLGSEDQKTRLLPACAQGKLLLALAADSEGLRFPRAVAVTGGEYMLNGDVPFVTHAQQADYLLVPARVADPSDDEKGETLCFLLDTGRAGVSVTAVKKMGYKGAPFAVINFDQVRLGADDVLGGADGLTSGVQQWTKIRDVALLATAAEAIGLSDGAFDYTLKHARQRKQFGQVIGRFGAIRNRFAEMASGIDAARLLLYRAAWLADRNESFHREVLIAAQAACETARRCTMEGLQIFGGYGYTMEYDIQRYVRDAAMLGAWGDELLKADLGATMGL
jgi:alkylation response protein AidB-like acyl-CoA dehydrogenase